MQYVWRIVWLHDVEIVAILHTHIFFTGQIGHNSQRMRNGPCKRFEHTTHTATTAPQKPSYRKKMDYFNGINLFTICT